MINSYILRSVSISRQTGIIDSNYQPTNVYYTPPGQFQNLHGQVNEV
jgi:hypothetical protein